MEYEFIDNDVVIATKDCEFYTFKKGDTGKINGVLPRFIVVIYQVSWDNGGISQAESTEIRKATLVEKAKRHLIKKKH